MLEQRSPLVIKAIKWPTSVCPGGRLTVMCVHAPTSARSEACDCMLNGIRPLWDILTGGLSHTSKSTITHSSWCSIITMLQMSTGGGTKHNHPWRSAAALLCILFRRRHLFLHRRPVAPSLRLTGERCCKSEVHAARAHYLRLMNTHGHTSGSATAVMDEPGAERLRWWEKVFHRVERLAQTDEIIYPSLWWL